MNTSEYKYNLPEDYTMKEKHRKKLDEIVAEAGMSNELAQKFIDLHVEITEEYVEEIEAAYASNV